jgi:hypothetical protein
MKPIVQMSKRAFIAEHKKLIKILEEGKKKDLLKEAKEQKKELAKYLKKK